MDIDKILLKVLNNKASSDEYAALESWKQESEANIKLLQELKMNAQKGVEGYKEYDTQSAWHKVETRIIKSEGQKPPTSRFIPWVIAAACLGLLITAFFLFSPEKEQFPSHHIAEQENLQFALADQSDIWLRGGGSTLDIISDFELERRVKLGGEAFFEITPDAERPFIIELENSDFVKVIGTSFNLLSDGSDFDLTIFSGIVELHTLDRVLTLTKGERATRIKDSIVIIENNDLNKLSWKSDQLTFDNTDIVTAFKAIESHFKTTIDFSDGSNDLTHCKVRTRFVSENIQQVLQELSTSHGFDYSEQGDKIIIQNLSCK